MISALEKNITFYQKGDIVPKDYLLDKIAFYLNKKYMHVFKAIKYDDLSLRFDISNILSKYLSTKEKKINIKYIEMTILNKIREKYRKERSPLNAINYKSHRLIKLPTTNKSISYINLDQENQEKNRNLSSVKNKSTMFNDKNLTELLNDDYKYFDRNNINIDNEFNNNLNEKNKNNTIPNSQINNENLENDKKGMNNELYELNNKIKELKIDVENIKKSIKYEEDLNLNPLTTNEQLEYLERKKRIEDDYLNKQNKFMFIRPKFKEILNDDTINIKNDGIYRYENVKINKYGRDKLNDYNLLKEKIKQEKEYLDRSIKDLRDRIYLQYRISDTYNNPNDIKYLLKGGGDSMEGRAQLKMLQKSLEEERRKQQLNNPSSSNNENNFKRYNSGLKKQREYEIADLERKSKIDRIKRIFDRPSEDKKKVKASEIKIDKKYKEKLDTDYELYLLKQKQMKKNYEDSEYGSEDGGGKYMENKFQVRTKNYLYDDRNNNSNK